eukprot:COSAG05_NODE_11560_length_507_cov_1.485294_1_plen_125_part_01
MTAADGGSGERSGRHSRGPSADARQQLWFLSLFFVSGVAQTFSNSLEAVYIGHIHPCEDSPALHCQLPFFSGGANASSCLAHENITCTQLLALRHCSDAVPSWAHVAPASTEKHLGDLFVHRHRG